MNDHRPSRSLSTPATYALLAALALALFVPRLGAFGFWDPHEIRVADAARAHMNGMTTLTQAAQQLGRPALPVALIAAGFKLIGVDELGGRLPIALTAVLAVLACFYAGTGLIRGRGALIGSFVLATTPAFLLGARQLTTNAPLMLATSLAVGGLARALWPDEGTPGWMGIVDALLAAAGLSLGQLAGGMLLGLTAPLAAVSLALFFAAPSGPRRGSAIAIGVAALALAGWFVYAWAHPAGYSPLLGGSPHPFTHNVVFTSALKQLGFGLFPWVALLPLAGIHALQSTTSDDEPSEREFFGRLVLVAWFVLLYLLATVQAAAAQELLVPLAPAGLLLVGAWLDDLLDSPEQQPFAALTIALGVIIVGRDLFMAPEQLAAAHILEAVRWPAPLTAIPYVLIGFAGFFAGVMALAIGVPLGRAANVEGRRRNRLILVGAGVGGALVMALATAHWMVPELSKHLSARDLYGKSKQLDPNAPVGTYRFNASGASYYTGGKQPTALPTLDEVFKFLGRPERVFVMAGVDELAAIDQYARQHHGSYVVVDNSSSRYVMLSNRLGPNEHDENPLRLFISDKAPTPQHPMSVNFENQLELIGWDAPPSVRKGADIKLRLYFKVLAPVPRAYKIFVHLDHGSTRTLGDHAPLEGRFPTNNWVPGYYITDEHLIHPDRLNQQPGPHQLFMGLFPGGSERMKILAGPSDGDNRALLGSILID